jgi:YgiT-type zinc finger domain-containing protein
MFTLAPRCGICETGMTEERSRAGTFKRDDQSVVVEGLLGHWCEACQDYTIDPDQARYNEKRVRAAFGAAA